MECMSSGLLSLIELDLSFNSIEEAYSLRNVDFKKIKKINLRNNLLDLNYYQIVLVLIMWHITMLKLAD